MADLELRALERRWIASGDVADEARLLDARRRIGALPSERLELAAWLGHPAARRALGDEAPAGEPAPWLAWAGALGADGLAVLLERVIASARQVALTQAGLQACSALEVWQAGGSAPAHALAEPLQESIDAALDAGALGEAACLLDLRGALRAAWALASQDERATPLARARTALLLRRLAGREGSATAQALVRWALGPPHAQAALQHVGTSDAARWLRGQLERERLPRGRLLLAAWSGHPAAREALGERDPDAPEGDRAWLEGVVRLDPDLARDLVLSLLDPAVVLLFQDVDVGTAWYAVEEAEQAARTWALAGPDLAAREDALGQLRLTLASLRGRIASEPAGLGRRALEACALGLEAGLDPARAPLAGEALLRFATRSNAVRLRRRLRARAIERALSESELALPEEAE